MTRVCLVGESSVDLRYELLSRETSREALATYELERPFLNAIAVDTVSVGAAVSLLNDLQWYIVRFVDMALVQEPSVDEEEWLTRAMAEQLRADETEPSGTAEYLKIYGVEPVEDDDGVGRLVEPLFARRTDGEVPTYDLRDVPETVVVRVTEEEFSP